MITFHFHFFTFSLSLSQSISLKNADAAGPLGDLWCTAKIPFFYKLNYAQTFSKKQLNPNRNDYSIFSKTYGSCDASSRYTKLIFLYYHNIIAICSYAWSTIAHFDQGGVCGVWGGRACGGLGGRGSDKRFFHNCAELLTEDYFWYDFWKNNLKMVILIFLGQVSYL